MTASTADHHTDRQLQELDERERTAWDQYRRSLSELAGADYEETELISWERLQQELEALAGERDRLVGAAPGTSRTDAP